MCETEEGKVIVMEKAVESALRKEIAGLNAAECELLKSIEIGKVDDSVKNLDSEKVITYEAASRDGDGEN
jgi:hypothetical protein